MVRILLMLVRGVVGAALLTLVLSYCGAGPVLALVGQLHLGWLLVGIALAIGHVFIVAWRWRLFCVALTGAAPDFGRLVAGCARSLILAPLLPATVGADAVRAVTLAGDTGSANAVRSVVCDRLLGLLALLLMVAAELPVLAPQLPSGAVSSLAIVSLAGIAGFFAVLLLRRWVWRIPVLGRYFGTIAGDLYRSLAEAAGRLGFAAGFAAHLVALLIFVALARSVDPGISFSISALVILPALLVVMVPVSLAGWGVREAAIATGFSLLGADPVPAVTASVLFGLSGPLSGAVVELGGRLYGLPGRVVRIGAP
jgi:glycosyltransferase 2 family protein